MLTVALLVTLLGFPAVLNGQDEGGCLEHDSPPPTCADFVNTENGEPVFIEHVYNCSRFWVCKPDLTDCLFECAPMVGGSLYFDVSIQYPDGPVCNYPELINCTNKNITCQCEVWQECVNGFECIPDCKLDTHCNPDEYCDFPDGGEGDCHKGCRNGVNCGGCGECVNHMCNEPDCCTDDDCPAGVCIDGTCGGCRVDDECPDCATCENNVCTKPECCVDPDCLDSQYCEADHTCHDGCRTDSDCPMPCDACENHACSNPECCVDTDCNDEEYCEADHTCQMGCREDSDCPMSCDACENHMCSNPECCIDTDCLDSQFCESDNTCQEGCRDDTDCPMSCDACENHKCSNPECCIDTDCLDSQYCESDNTCQEGCRDDTDCPMACDACENHMCSNPECCVDIDCLDSQYCETDSTCQEGCRTDADCAMPCDACENHSCSNPECCEDSDCLDSEICDADNICKDGCRDDTACPGYDALCDLQYTNCNYCNNTENAFGQCNPGCVDDDNCPSGAVCTGEHSCVTDGFPLLNLISFTTESCNDCPSSNTEGGITMSIVGGEGTEGQKSCNTNSLDNASEADYAPGKNATFHDKDTMGSCYKSDLRTEVTTGTVTWTSEMGEWAPSKGLIHFDWTGGKDCTYSCCLSEASLSPQKPTATLINCERDCQGNKVC